MGGVITFLAIYINLPEAGLLGLVYNGFILNIKVNIKELIFIALLAIPAIAGIANIMLANNICDIHDDLENKRCTLPIYVGKEKALTIYKSLYYAGFLSIAVLIVIGVLPIVSAISLISIIPVQNNINLFYKSQLKNKTFATAVKNFAIVNVALILTIGAGIILKIRL